MSLNVQKLQPSLTWWPSGMSRQWGDQVIGSLKRSISIKSIAPFSGLHAGDDNPQNPVAHAKAQRLSHHVKTRLCQLNSTLPTIIISHSLRCNVRTKMRVFLLAITNPKIQSRSHKGRLNFLQIWAGRPGSLQKNINRILTLLILDFVYVNSNTNSLRYHMQEHCSVMYCTEYSSLSPTSLHCSYKHTLTTITIISFIAIINFTKFTSFMTKHTQYPRP